MFTYEKSLLKTFGEIEDVLELMDRSFYKRAVGSHSSKLSAYDEAEEMIELIELKKELIALYLTVSDVLSGLKKEDYRLLDERYGFFGDKRVTDEVNRNYYRKLALAVGRFSYRLRKSGITEDRFKNLTKKFHFLAEAYAEEKAKENAANVRISKMKVLKISRNI